MRSLAILGLVLTASPLVAQQDVRRDIDALLADRTVSTEIASLGERFARQVLMLVPDTPPDDVVALADLVNEAFDLGVFRADVARIMAAGASAEVVEGALRIHESGASAELGAIAEAYDPAVPLHDFIAGLGAPPPERIQLLAALAQARGDSEFGLLLEEAVRAMAHAFVNALGADVPTYEPIPDQQFEEAYRQRIVATALELLHGLQPASDDLIRRVIDEYQTEDYRLYGDAYIAAMTEAVQLAGQRVVDQATAGPAEPEVEPVDPGRPCRGQICGLVVEWDGRRPSGPNRRFGAADALESRVLEHLTSGGYRVVLGTPPEGLTIRLRGRLTLGLCDVMSGTDNTGCEAIDQVRVEFLGVATDSLNLRGLTIRNRCGADGLLDVDGLGLLVALRLDYALTTYPGDERPVPRC